MMDRLLKEIGIGEKEITFGDIVIGKNTPELQEKIVEILTFAEGCHPNDLMMQEHIIKTQLEAFVNISGLRAQLNKIGEPDEEG